MSQYEISNRTSGQCLGTYTGETLEEALTAAAQDAGYLNHAHACEVTGACDDLIAEEVEEDDDYPFDAVTRVEITDDQIDRLLITSVYQGDHDVVLTCLAALDGSERHRAECLRVIGEAREMGDRNHQQGENP